MAFATAVMLVAPPALAQDAPAPTPSPSPARTPSIITLPGVVPERYSLPGTSVPVQAPPPIVVPNPTPTPGERAAPSPAERPRADRRPAAAPKPIAAPPTPAPTLVGTPVRAPVPVTTAAPPPVIVRAPTPAAQSAMPGWLWMLIGAVSTAVLASAAWLFLRRREAASEDPVEQRPAPPPPVPQPVSSPPPRAPVLAPRSDPFEIDVRPARAEFGEREVTLDFELLIVNRQAEPAEAVRLSLAMMSASPDQDRILSGFHRGPPGETAGEPFDLAPGGGVRMPVRLMLPRESVHVVQVRGRPMFVAMALIDLRWRSSLSIRRFGADFMIGTAGQGDKVGPIWLDRGQPGVLGATRYVPREAAAA